MSRGRLSFGLIIILVGVLLLLRNSGFAAFSIGELFHTYWPVLLIAVGLNALPGRNSGSWSGGLTVVLIGVLFLGRNLAWWSFESITFWKLLWPALLILIGVELLFRGWGKTQRQERDHWNRWSEPGAASAEIHHEAILGGLKLDLRQEQLAEGESVIHLTAVLGGIELWVPADLRVLATGTAVLGGLEFFGRSNGGLVAELRAEQGRREEPGADMKRLRIDGTAVLGGITVRSVQ
ncbi:putative membrane protein [Hydrogenispora ethanolica]|jgi:hypothetical protein|uniref:Putative membrane protein n=1 Tax=Hydrogenispora ethanolica TaxID=1082276 RepID=A0A4V2QF77_HYDET|nr:DUF5668 domain-containing protein [Hydrogenispora ethanolica]TCL70877.1 putative membrane protein [Hydrogenispora ethanolica]